jgi:SpoVK/Ycf46/Vps4 family AAA+-type ATPase
MAKKYCPICFDQNGFKDLKIYTNGEECCEIHKGKYLAPYARVMSAGAGTDSVPKKDPAPTVTVKKDPVTVKKDPPAPIVVSIPNIQLVPGQTPPAKPVSVQTKAAQPKTPVATGSIVENAFANRGLIGLTVAREDLEHYYREFDGEQYKKALASAATEDRTITSMHLLVVGDELTGKTEVAHIAADVLNRAGIRRNEEPDVVSLKEFESVMGDPDALKQFMSAHKDHTVLVGEPLDEAFLEINGDVQGDANKCSDLLNALKLLKGSCTLIFELSEDLKEKMLKVAPRTADCFKQIHVGHYTEDELVLLTKKRITQDFGYRLTEGALKRIRIKIRQTSFEEYSQGRFIVELYEEATRNLYERLKKHGAGGKNERFTITEEDIPVRIFNEAAAEKALQKILNRPGQAKLKEYAQEIFDQAKDNQEAILRGEPLINIQQKNFTLEGEAGAGKTSSIPLLADLLVATGVISKAEPLLLTVADLQGKAVGETPEKVKECIAKARGRLMVIDEAYQLAVAGNYGEDAVHTLVNELGKQNCEVVVCLIGYRGSLDPVFKMNQGMNRRFPHRILMDNLTLDEMVQIFRQKAVEYGITLADDVDVLIRTLIDRRRRVKDFGNAGGVINLLESLLPVMRQAGTPRRLTQRILLEAIGDLQGDGVTEALRELDSLIGLTEVKKMIKDLVQELKGLQKLKDAGLNPAEKPNLHLVLTGNPGSGKTSVARIIMKLYASLGMLAYSDKIKEIRGKDLIAGYVGQTEERVTQIFRDAEGGILYIDEAIELNNGTCFGDAAINAIVGEIDARGKSLMLILSGYKDEMDQLLAKNQGLASRFPTRLNFPDYTDDELWMIFQSMIQKNNFRLEQNPKLEERVRSLLRMKKREPGFGNARTVRNLVQACCSSYEVRLGGDDTIPASELGIIRLIDIPEKF